MDTCNSISLYKLNLSYEARIRIILWAMVLLLQGSKIYLQTININHH